MATRITKPRPDLARQMVATQITKPRQGPARQMVATRITKPRQDPARQMVAMPITEARQVLEMRTVMTQIITTARIMATQGNPEMEMPKTGTTIASQVKTIRRMKTIRIQR